KQSLEAVLISGGLFLSFPRKWESLFTIYELRFTVSSMYRKSYIVNRNPFFMRLFIALIALPLSSLAQTGSEIYLMDIKKRGDQINLSNPVNITNHKGYDNQPYFNPDRGIVYFSSFDDSGRSNIKWYEIKSRKSELFTETRDREYSPTITPDGRFISCIVQRDNGAQDLVK